MNNSIVGLSCHKENHQNLINLLKEFKLNVFKNSF